MVPDRRCSEYPKLLRLSRKFFGQCEGLWEATSDGNGDLIDGCSRHRSRRASHVEMAIAANGLPQRLDSVARNGAAAAGVAGGGANGDEIGAEAGPRWQRFRRQASRQERRLARATGRRRMNAFSSSAGQWSKSDPADLSQVSMSRAGQPTSTAALRTSCGCGASARAPIGIRDGDGSAECFGCGDSAITAYRQRDCQSRNVTAAGQADFEERDAGRGLELRLRRIRSSNSPAAAVTGARPFTARTTAAMVDGSAAPSEPRSGSFTSITSAPPASAASASLALRTLTKQAGPIVVAEMQLLSFGSLLSAA